jgi:hypothetical protein
MSDLDMLKVAMEVYDGRAIPQPDELLGHSGGTADGWRN